MAFGVVSLTLCLARSRTANPCHSNESSLKRDSFRRVCVWPSGESNITNLTAEHTYDEKCVRWKQEPGAAFHGTMRTTVLIDLPRQGSGKKAQRDVQSHSLVSPTLGAVLSLDPNAKTRNTSLKTESYVRSLSNPCTVFLTICKLRASTSSSFLLGTFFFCLFYVSLSLFGFLLSTPHIVKNKSLRSVRQGRHAMTKLTAETVKRPT